MREIKKVENTANFDMFYRDVFNIYQQSRYEIPFRWNIVFNNFPFNKRKKPGDNFFTHNNRRLKIWNEGPEVRLFFVMTTINHLIFSWSKQILKVYTMKKKVGKKYLLKMKILLFSVLTSVDYNTISESFWIAM